MFVCVFVFLLCRSINYHNNPESYVFTAHFHCSFRYVSTQPFCQVLKECRFNYTCVLGTFKLALNIAKPPIKCPNVILYENKHIKVKFYMK